MGESETDFVSEPRERYGDLPEWDLNRRAESLRNAEREDGQRAGPVDCGPCCPGCPTAVCLRHTRSASESEHQ